MTTVTINDAGQLTIPEELRRQLGWVGATELAIEVTHAGYALTLRFATPYDDDDDSWALRPDVQASLQRALADSRAGRVYEMSESDLQRLADMLGPVRGMLPPLPSSRCSDR